MSEELTGDHFGVGDASEPFPQGSRQGSVRERTRHKALVDRRVRVKLLDNISHQCHGENVK